MLPSLAPALPGRLAGLALGIAVLAGASNAAAGPGDAVEGKKACIVASERAQVLRKEGKLLDARAQALACARPECPGALAADCSQLVGTLSAKIPTLVVRARTAAGDDLPDADVTLDGAPVAVEQRGRAIELDPGVHTLRVELRGFNGVEKRILAGEGESGRILDIVLVPSALVPEPPPRPPSPAPAKAERPGRAIPLAAWVFGGIGLLGVVGVTYFGLRVLDDIGTAEGMCAPRCSDDELAPLRARRIAADVSLGVGVVGLGVATWLVLRGEPSRESAPSRGARLGVDVRPGGGALSLSGPL